MRLTLDMLGAQTESSRHRGIGRYTINFAKAVSEIFGEQGTLHLLAARAPADAVTDMLSAMGPDFPAHRIKTVELPSAGKTDTADNSLAARMQHAAFARGAAATTPDVYHVSSLFEYGVNYPDPSRCGALVSSVTVLDLIPLVFASHYLRQEEESHWYRDRLETLKKFDLFLAISQSAKNDLVEHLGIDPEKIVVLLAGCDERFQPKQVSAKDNEVLLTDFGIQKPFLLYTGGMDWRKNHEGAIRAYALLSEDLRLRHCLVFVCSIAPHDAKRLAEFAASVGLRDGELIITGHVSDESLVLLYQSCAAFVFPSIYEGFGLPVLEAMACGAPVICADNSSLPEVLGRRDALFDALDDRSIAAAMGKVLTDAVFRRELSEWGVDRARCLTWRKAAEKAVFAWTDAVARARKKTRLPLERKHRLAFLSPMPPEASGIADYSAELLEQLVAYYDIHVFTTAVTRETDGPGGLYTMYPSADFPSVASTYERIVYQIGNNAAFHSPMLEWTKVWPGTTVLHDFFLSGLANHEQCVSGRHHYFFEKLLSSHGPEALHTIIGADHEPAVFNYPASRDVFENAEGVIVRSHTLGLINSHYPEGVGAPVSVIPHLRVCRRDFAAVRREAVRNRLGINPDEVVIATFGHVLRSKCPENLIEAFAKLVASGVDNVRLVFVGTSGDCVDFQKLVPDTPLAKRISITGFASRQVYEDWLIAADIGVQLRRLSRGETSGAVLDCLAFGLPVILNRYAGFTDYEDGSVEFIGAEADPGELAMMLARMAGDAPGRLRLSQSGSRRLAEVHQPAFIGAAYAEAIESFYARGFARNAGRLLMPMDGCESDAGGIDGFLTSLAESTPILRTPRFYYDISEFRHAWNESRLHGVPCLAAELFGELRKASKNGEVWPVSLIPGTDRFEVVVLDFSGKWVSTGIPVRYQHGDRYVVPSVRKKPPEYGDAFEKLARAGVGLSVVDEHPRRLSPAWLKLGFRFVPRSEALRLFFPEGDPQRIR